MGLFIENIMRKASCAVRNWWLLLVAGILFAALGVTVFCFPADSYLTLAWLFGIAILLSGLVQLGLSFSRNFILTRSSMIAGGILDVLLGLVLVCNINLTLAMMPFLLGLWILYHGFMTMGLGSDLMTFGVQGGGWALTGGIVLVIVSALIIIWPWTVGRGFLLFLVGLGFFVYGIVSIAISFRLRDVHTYVKKLNE